MNTIKTKEPVWFKRKPVTEDSIPNAVFVRHMGSLPNGESVCEIEYQQDKWLVNVKEVISHKVALQEVAKRYKSEIDAATEPNQLRKDLARKIGYSTSTLLSREKFIKKYLPPDENVPS